MRKSVLDRVRESKRFHLYRLIFCAKITNYENIVQLFNAAIKERYSQHVTGLLLVYSDFVIHLIEGSEDEVFRLCNEIFTANAEIITNTKCLYVQSNSKKRFFQKWYFKRMNDCTLKDEEPETFEDTFENACNIYKIITLNLHKLYTELWNWYRLKNYVCKCMLTLHHFVRY